MTANRTLLIDVTQADIDAATAARRQVIARHQTIGAPAPTGITDNCCPIAMALKRAFPEAHHVSACVDVIWVGYERDLEGDDYRLNRFRGSERTRRFMRQWDVRWKAVPTRFRLKQQRAL